MRVTTTNWKQIGASVLLASAIFVLLSLQTKAASQSDAIAVRIMPNVNHDSIDTWYARQGYQGSPQSLIVDGYEAIRDGRTVFVNAANIDSSDWYVATNESDTVAGRECKIRIAVDSNTGATQCSFDLFVNPSAYSEEFTGTIKYTFNTPYCAVAQCPNIINVNKCRWSEGAKAWSGQCSVRSRGNKIYTNIYLISYNQESETKTLDILGQLVSHWKFNNNIADVGQCSISSLNCQADADCPTDFVCDNNKNNQTYSKCILKTDKICVIDSDCPVNLFCDSLKARSIRDISRLGKINQITSAIESYKNSNGKYPSLQSGTYVLGSSISVWPSWKETLWSQLGLSQLIIDPINTLGYCEGYDAITCWDSKNNTFVNSSLSLPGGSYAFVYTAAQNGINYSLCSVFETKDLGYDTLDNKISANSCSVSNTFIGSTSNTAPYVFNYYASGETGKEFNGYIKVKDEEGDLISWSLSSVSSFGGWSAAPVLQDTGDASQKKIYASKTGSVGSYDMNLNLIDSRGAATTTKLTIKISAAGKPVIEAEDATYFVDPINPLKYTFSVEGSNSKPTYTFLPNTSYLGINLEIAKAILNASVTSVGLNKNKIDLSILIPTSTPIIQDFVIPVRITATANGASSTKDVNLSFKIEKPYLDFTCENMARIGQVYPISGNYCLIGKTTSGNHSFTYSVSSIVGNLAIDTSHYNEGDIYLGASAVNISAPTSTDVKVSVTNEYGASAEKSFNLKINSSCGDDIKQNPNTEGSGGLNNDGVEQCDGSAGTVTNTISTSSSIQYGCTTESGIPSPYPIINNQSCVFKDFDKGGGYCGDGVCQFNIMVGGQSKMMENCWNCRQDCGICLATLESKADISHAAYLNGNILYEISNFTNLGTKKIPLVPGKNVFSFWAQRADVDNFGLAFKLTAGASTTAAISYASGNLFQEFSTKTPLPEGKLVCIGELNPNTNYSTLDFDDSNWVATKVNQKKDLFKGAPYVWLSGMNNSDQIFCRLTFDYKSYSMTACVPECTNKNCGSDGCGGSCGICGTDSFCSTVNYQCQPKCGSKKCGYNTYDGGSCGNCTLGTACIDGQCPSSDTNIQICADNAHTSYFNGSNTSTDGRAMKGADWSNVEKFKVKLAEQNIFAIEAVDWGGIHGLSATLNMKIGGVDKISLNTNDTAGWQCNRTATTGWKTDWNADNSWSDAISMNNKSNTAGNALASSTNATAGISQIWLNDSKYPAANKAFSYTSTTKTDTIYCRYKFKVSEVKIPCVANCTNKCGGFDGCSGYCSNACLVAGEICGGDPAKLNECSTKK